MKEIKALLEKKFPTELVDPLLQTFKEIQANYSLRKWKASELDAGLFVEAVRRIVELALTGKFTPLGTSLPNFSDVVLKQYEQAPGDESFRILIPRVLKATYNIRNKRGAGHLTGVSPNEMDATFILYSSKWVLAELVRLASGLAPEKTQALVDQIMERQIELLWKSGTVTRVLETRLRTREQVLVLLYDDSPRADSELQRIVEYTNVTNFKKILRDLHANRIIEYGAGGACVITPKGIAAAEDIINSLRRQKRH